MTAARNLAVPKVTVVDALMGAGKTTTAIRMLDNLASGYETVFEDGAQRFIYITPFLEEVERVKDALAEYSGKIAFDPKPKNGRKLDHLNEMIEEGRNIVSTHSLFAHTDRNTYDALDNFQYTLFIDEVADWVERYAISARDLELLYGQAILSVDEATRRIVWTDPPGEEYRGKFDELRSLCKQGKIVASRFGSAGGPTLLLWVFPVEMLSRFKEVYIFTHLFDGSDMAAYLRLHRVEVHKATIGRDRSTLVDYDEAIERTRLAAVRPLITVVDDPKLNAVGTRTGKSNPLSVSWFRSDHQRGCKQMTRLKQATYTYFRHRAGTRSSENLWSTFSVYRSKLSGDRYSRAFLACNARSTNEYRGRRSLAYLVNLYHHPFIRAYFEDANVVVSEDYFALLTMTQWVWRSQVRDGKPILLYVPSERMRTLFLNWLDGRLPITPLITRLAVEPDSTEIRDTDAVAVEEHTAEARSECEVFA